jgi:hypothetical protein
MFFQNLPRPGRIEQWAHFEYTFVLMLWATHLKFMYHVFSHEFSRARARHSSKPRRRPSRFTMSDDDGFLAEAASAGHDAAEAELLAMPLAAADFSDCPPLAKLMAENRQGFEEAKGVLSELRSQFSPRREEARPTSAPTKAKRARTASQASPTPAPAPPLPPTHIWRMGYDPRAHGGSLSRNSCHAFRHSLPSQPKEVGLMQVHVGPQWRNPPPPPEK